MNKNLKKIFATLALGAMVFGAGVSPALAASVEDTAYVVVTANDSMTYSMSMMSFDGEYEVVDYDADTVTVNFPLKAFSYSRLGISGVGYLATMTVNGVDYEAEGFASSPNAGDTGDITVTFNRADFNNVVIDGTTYLDAHVEASIKIASIIPMTQGKDVHLYFSSTEIPYVENGTYTPAGTTTVAE